MRAFVTGATGFIGTHLIDQLQTARYDVAGLARHQPEAQHSWRHFGGDITEHANVTRAIEDWAPDVIFHLAGTRAASTLAALFAVNVGGAANVIEAASRLRSCRVVVVGSSAVYGAGDAITEEAPFAPVSTYGASKVALDVLAAQQIVATGLDIVRVRPFNVIGPGQSGDNVGSVCAQQIVDAERGKQPPTVTLGNLDATRDFVDVRDVARALIGIAERGARGTVYNVCTGRGVRARGLVDAMLACAKLDLAIEERSRPASGVDVAKQVGSYGRLARDLGWSPEYDLHRSARDIVEHVRARYS